MARVSGCWGRAPARRWVAGPPAGRCGACSPTGTGWSRSPGEQGARLAAGRGPRLFGRSVRLMMSCFLAGQAPARAKAARGRLDATCPAAPVSALAMPTSERRPVIASATVGKVARCRSRPVADKTLATSGVGAARRSHPPSRPARRPAPTRTARPLASAYPTADRSTIRRLAPGRSKPRSFSRRAGADVMSSPPRSTAIT
jgi:hypothetical protein